MAEPSSAVGEDPHVAKIINEAGLDVEERRAPNGGMIYANDEEVKEQRQIGWEFLKSLPHNLLGGGNLTNVSLPVKFFEERSYLERMTEYWSCASVLSQAADTKDPIQRLMYVIGFAVGGLHKEVVPQRKPFNPILGETFQAGFPDGTRIFCEQTSHHPPISSFEVFGPNQKWRMWGYLRLSAAIRGNNVRVMSSGTHWVEFPDGQQISFDIPPLYCRGILFGQRVAEFGGTMHFNDAKNRIGCNLVFNPDAKSWMGTVAGWFSGAKTSPVDTVRAELFTYESGDDWTEESPKTVIALGEGSWLSSILFKDVKVWDIKTTPKWKAMPVAASEVLPSDCRFREDLQAVAAKNWDDAQKWKVALEEKQREEARWRKSGLTGVSSPRSPRKRRDSIGENNFDF